MLSFVRIIALAVTVVSMYGCATSPVPDSQATAVPTHRVLAPALTRAADGTGQLVVTRDSGAAGSACNARLYVDAQPVADLSTSERIALFVPVGEHVLSVNFPAAICAGGLTERAVVIDQARPKRFRIGFGTAMEVVLQPTAF